MTCHYAFLVKIVIRLGAAALSELKLGININSGNYLVILYVRYLVEPYNQFPFKNMLANNFLRAELKYRQTKQIPYFTP